MSIAALEEIRERLHDRKLTVVAQSTGLHYNTVYRIANGSSKDPAYSVIKRLSDYLDQEGGDRGGYNKDI
jgi:transcriptional regulator with XRE-family HTH domain